MKKFSIIMIIAILLGACAPQSTPEPAISTEPTNTLPSELPTPVVETTLVPEVDSVVSSFLEYWRQDDYPNMYNMLTNVSKDALTYEEFEKKLKE